jgi:hypothetical protein
VVSTLVDIYPGKMVEHPFSVSRQLYMVATISYSYTAVADMRCIASGDLHAVVSAAARPGRPKLGVVAREITLLPLKVFNTQGVMP